MVLSGCTQGCEAERGCDKAQPRAHQPLRQIWCAGRHAGACPCPPLDAAAGDPLQARIGICYKSQSVGLNPSTLESYIYVLHCRVDIMQEKQIMRACNFATSPFSGTICGSCTEKILVARF